MKTAEEWILSYNLNKNHPSMIKGHLRDREIVEIKAIQLDAYNQAIEDSKEAIDNIFVCDENAEDGAGLINQASDSVNQLLKTTI